MKIISVIFLLFLFLTNVYGQNLYKDYNLNDTIKGEKLTLGTGNMGYLHSSDNGNYLNISINAVYSKWKYTPTNQLYIQANLYSNYYRTNYEDQYSIERNALNSRNSYDYEFGNFLYAGIGASHYFSPKSLYISGSFSAAMNTVNTNNYGNGDDYSSIFGTGFLWTGLGYGRIQNAEGLERALTASDLLLKHKIIKSKLSDKSLKEIDVKLAEFRNGNYLDKFLDDESVNLMKDIESILLKNNEISGKLDAESSVRLFQALLNSSKKYYYYPRYIGAQLDAQLQAQVFSYEKPKENYLTFSGVYGYPVSEKTNLLFTAAYVNKLNTDAYGYLNWFPNYYSYYGISEDYNNAQFNNPHSGLDVFSGGYYLSLNSHNSLIKAAVSATNSLNSTAGLILKAEYYLFPANKDTEYSIYSYFYSDPMINEYYYNISGQLDYNIYSKLFSHIKAGFGESNNSNGFSIYLTFDYVVF